MSQNPFVQPATNTATIDRKLLVAATPGVANAARWFWWIAALSLINSVLIHSGSNTSFVVGLGFTLVADAFFQAFKPIAFAIDAAALAFFFAMGWFALRGFRSAFWVGGVLYTLDALIYLYFGDYLPVAFHAWALYSITTGSIALHKAIKLAEQAALQPPKLESAVSAEPPPVAPTA